MEHRHECQSCSGLYCENEPVGLIQVLWFETVKMIRVLKKKKKSSKFWECPELLFVPWYVTAVGKVLRLQGKGKDFQNPLGTAF